MSGKRFFAKENLDGDRESWWVWDREEYGIADPLEDCCDLSLAEAEAQARRLNLASQPPTKGETDG